MAFINTFDLSKNNDYISIRSHIFSALFKRLGISSLGELDQLSPEYVDKIDLDLRYEMDLMSIIDSYLRNIIASYIGPVQFVQFPVNIRVISPFVPSNSFNRPFSTDYLHCDCWSQAPSDSSNIFLYLHYTPNAPKLDFYDVADKDFQSLLSYKGPYKNAPTLAVDKTNHEAGDGIMHEFPTHTLHKTNRGTNGFRISLDVRYRPLSKYFEDSNEIDALLKDDWLASRMTSLGVYWLFTERFCDTFQKRISTELVNSLPMGNRYIQKRKSYINRFYPGCL